MAGRFKSEAQRKAVMAELKKGRPVSVRAAGPKYRYKLTDKQEESKLSDLGRFDVIPDKIRVNDEPFINLHTVYNKGDAETFKRVFREIYKKHYGVDKPVVYRRGYQNDVYYEIYIHRWGAYRPDGTYVEASDYMDDLPEKKYVEFKKEVNARLGKIYIV